MKNAVIILFCCFICSLSYSQNISFVDSIVTIDINECKGVLMNPKHTRITAKAIFEIGEYFREIREDTLRDSIITCYPTIETIQNFEKIFLNYINSDKNNNCLNNFKNYYRQYLLFYNNEKGYMIVKFINKNEIESFESWMSFLSKNLYWSTSRNCLDKFTIIIDINENRIVITD